MTSIQPRYQLLTGKTATALRSRPMIGCVMIGIFLVILTFFLSSTSVSNAPEESPRSNEIVKKIIGNEDVKKKSDVLKKNPPITQSEASEASEANEATRNVDSNGGKAWFGKDPPGLDEITGPRRSIWQYEISLEVNKSRTDSQRKHPQMAFIKGLKVGGTSVAMALDHAARQYGIRLQSRVTESMNRQDILDQVHCVQGGSLWFHHGYKHDWMKRCMPNVRFITLLREPISQSLSWEAMTVSHSYYLHYPRKECDHKRQVEIMFGRNIAALNAMLKPVDHCVDTAYRKNVTLQLVAHAVSQFHVGTGEQRGFPGMAVTLGTEWITGGLANYGRLTGKRYIKFLKENYFLVGVTDRLNEFLVLLALHMGWDPASLYYKYCKPTDTEVHRSEFERYFPQLMPKLEKSTTTAREAYEWAKTEFDSHVNKLGPWFKEVVAKFEKGLNEYQEAMKDKTRPFQWKLYHYLDHHGEDC